MDIGKQESENQLPARFPSAVAVRSSGGVVETGEGGQAGLPEIVRQVQEGSRQPSSTFWRRVLFFWFRIYKYECLASEKSSVLDLRIPIPLPLIGAVFQQKLSWSQAFQFIEQGRRPDGIPPERFLESCMPLEFIRFYEGKNGKDELLVIGLD